MFGPYLRYKHYYGVAQITQKFKYALRFLEQLICNMPIVKV